jgi:hypothetical protein
MAHFLVLATSVLFSPFAPRVTVILLVAYVLEGTMRR